MPDALQLWDGIKQQGYSTTCKTLSVLPDLHPDEAPAYMTQAQEQAPFYTLTKPSFLLSFFVSHLYFILCFTLVPRKTTGIQYLLTK